MNDKSRDWWNMQSLDNQIWLLMKHGFENFNPKNVKLEQISKLYKLEH